MPLIFESVACYLHIWQNQETFKSGTLTNYVCEVQQTHANISQIGDTHLDINKSIAYLCIDSENHLAYV